MKILLSLLITISIFVVSYFSMMYGWDLEPANMHWIIGGYVWVCVAGGLQGILGD